MRTQDLVDAFNAVEAVLWIGLAIVVVFRKRRPRPVATYAWALALVLFGISDLVELQTGAFWRPWWLLAWKAGCIAAFLGLFAQQRKLKLTNLKAAAASKQQLGPETKE